MENMESWEQSLGDEGEIERGRLEPEELPTQEEPAVDSAENRNFSDAQTEGKMTELAQERKARIEELYTEIVEGFRSLGNEYARYQARYDGMMEKFISMRNVPDAMRGLTTLHLSAMKATLRSSRAVMELTAETLQDQRRMFSEEDFTDVFQAALEDRARKLNELADEARASFTNAIQRDETMLANFALTDLKTSFPQGGIEDSPVVAVDEAEGEMVNTGTVVGMEEGGANMEKLQEEYYKKRVLWLEAKRKEQYATERDHAAMSAFLADRNNPALRAGVAQANEALRTAQKEAAQLAVGMGEAGDAIAFASEDAMATENIITVEDRIKRERPDLKNVRP